MKKIRLIIIAVIVLFWAALTYYGMFTSVEITQAQKGPYYLVYKEHKGDYAKVGPVMDEVYYDLRNNKNIFSAKGFGLYYDNPEEVAKENLRSVVGCIVPLAKIDGIEGDYKIAEFPSSKAVVSTFPYRGTLSFIMAVIKVYPKLQEHLQTIETLKEKEEFAIMEIYDMENNIIEFVAATDVQDSVFKAIINQK